MNEAELQEATRQLKAILQDALRLLDPESANREKRKTKAGLE